MSTSNQARTAAVDLLDLELRMCLSDYVHPNGFGGFDVDSREAAEVVVDTLLANPAVLAALSASGRLTGREREVVALVAAGHPNKTIATKLGISPWTVSSYLRRVFVRLGVESRAQMVAVVMERGLLTTPESTGGS